MAASKGTALAVVPRPGESPLGPMLWQGVRLGMTAAEVQRLHPGVLRGVRRGTLHDGATAMLSLPRMRLCAHEYVVDFYFRDARLTQVMIASNGKPRLRDFRDLTNALRLRYGREVDMTDSADGFSVGEWLSADGVNIGLVAHLPTGVLNLTYQCRFIEAARQL